jgi:putative transcriptional regulator
VSVTHHVSDALLADYESGALTEGWSLAVATHLALCPACRARARLAASVGGSLLDSIPPAEVGTSALDDVLGRIDAARDVKPARTQSSGTFPEPLSSYLGGADVEALPWRRLSNTARDLRIPTGDGKTNARLLRIAAGSPVPEHGHRGMELTVVLSGTLCDGPERFGRGDLEETDESIKHQPFAGSEADCICLAVTDAPLRFKSLLVRLVQPFLQI